MRISPSATVVTPDNTGTVLKSTDVEFTPQLTAAFAKEQMPLNSKTKKLFKDNLITGKQSFPNQPSLEHF
jgi:hypothetical protein